MEIFYSEKFKKSAKRLSKNYKNFKNDLKRFVDRLNEEKVVGVEILPNIYKIRIKNSDNNKGKSAGYRVIIYYFSEDKVLLLDIYSKSDISNLSDSDIYMIVKRFEEGNRS